MQIAILFIFLLVASSPRSFGQAYVNFSTKTLGDRATMQKRITSAVNNHAKYLNSIRDDLKAVIATSPSDQKTVLEASLATIDAIIERRDTSGIANLLPLVDLLHANNTDESPRILGNLENSGVQIGLNYLIDAVFNSRLLGEGDTILDRDLGAMVSFYAGNPAQTSEGSWLTNNTMLFIFGDRLVDYLSKQAPDKLAAFYKAVQDARTDARSGPGPDETPIPASELPTAEQLSRYEAAFARLETLATQGRLPNATGSPANASNTPAKPLPKVAPSSPTSPAPNVSASTSPTSGDESPATTPWSVVVVLIVAATGLLWLLLKRRS